MMGKMNLIALFGAAAALVGTVGAQTGGETCFGGIPGIQASNDACCVTDCGVCGGAMCAPNPNTTSLTAADCCASEIVQSGSLCTDTNAAPCRLTPLVVEPGTVCSNDLPGVEAKGVCCKAGCGECGGPNCGQVPGLTGDDCCTSTIQNSNVTCSQAGAAPCILDPEEFVSSTCPNGILGVADGDICCNDACNGVCGGSGCSARPNTAGAADCCSGDIRAANITCNGPGSAPCVMAPGSFTPAPTALPTRAPGATLAPGLFSMAPTPFGQTPPPTVGPTVAPVPAGSPAPVAGSRGGGFTGAPTDGASSDPNIVPGITEAPGATSPPQLVGESSGAGALSVGGVVTAAAMAGGLFAVFAAAARN